jgi:hypothetical protein
VRFGLRSICEEGCFLWELMDLRESKGMGIFSRESGKIRRLINLNLVMLSHFILYMIL